MKWTWLCIMVGLLGAPFAWAAGDKGPDDNNDDDRPIQVGRDEVIVTLRDSIRISGPRFGTVARAAQYIAQTVRRKHLGTVQLERNSAGKIIGVRGNTASEVQDTILVTDLEGGVEELDRFSTILGGLRGFITVRGEKICLRDEGCGICAGGDFDPEFGCICPEGFEAVAGDCRLQEPFQEPASLKSKVEKCDPELVNARGQPLFCTRNESFKHNFVVYKSIGSETIITRGRISYHSCIVIVEGLFEICQVEGHTALTLHQAYFGTFPPTFDQPEVVDTPMSVVINANSIKHKHWSLFVDPKIECEFGPKCKLVGVCAHHGSSTEQNFGIGDTRAVTARGAVDPRFLGCIALP